MIPTLSLQALLLLSLSLITLTTSSPINFDPTTGETNYQTVQIEAELVSRRPADRRSGGGGGTLSSSRTITTTVELRNDKIFRLDLRHATDPVSRKMLRGLKPPPSLVSMNGSGRIDMASGTDEEMGAEPDDQGTVFIKSLEITRYPEEALSVVCTFGNADVLFKPGRRVGVVVDVDATTEQPIEEIYCTAYYLINQERFARTIERWVDPDNHPSRS